jgi:esterase/lipase
VERTAPGLPGHRAVEWLRALGESFQAVDVPKEKADLMHAIYKRITVAGLEIVGVRLTAAAYAHGLALALPERL